LIDRLRGKRHATYDCDQDLMGVRIEPVVAPDERVSVLFTDDTLRASPSHPRR
jgi:hypothetical protein